MVEKDLKRIQEVQQELKEILTKKNETVKPKRWCTNEDLMEVLKVSRRTLSNWRDHGLIGFLKVGSKIFYSYADVAREIWRSMGRLSLISKKSFYAPLGMGHAKSVFRRMELASFFIVSPEYPSDTLYLSYILLIETSRAHHTQKSAHENVHRYVPLLQAAMRPQWYQVRSFH